MQKSLEFPSPLCINFLADLSFIMTFTKKHQWTLHRYCLRNVHWCQKFSQFDPFWVVWIYWENNKNPQHTRFLKNYKFLKKPLLPFDLHKSSIWSKIFIKNLKRSIFGKLHLSKIILINKMQIFEDLQKIERICPEIHIVPHPNNGPHNFSRPINRRIRGVARGKSPRNRKNVVEEWCYFRRRYF